MYEIMCFDEYGNSIDELVQWDTNRVLYIDWEHNCTPIFQFGNTDSDRLLVVKGRILENETKKIAEVNIPNILLQQACPIISFVYLESEVDGNDHYYAGRTVYNFKIPVRMKHKPEDYKYTENTEYISWINLESEAREYITELKNETAKFKEEYETTLNTIRENVAGAVQSATEAKASEVASRISEQNAKTSEQNAKDSENQAKNSQAAAYSSEVASKSSEQAAKSSEQAAKSSEQAAKSSEEKAKASEEFAADVLDRAENVMAKSEETFEKAEQAVSEAERLGVVAESAVQETVQNAERAEVAADEASESAMSSSNNAMLSKSYAVGGTNTRTNEDVDNAKYYYLQAKMINDDLGGVFSPRGTIEFSALQSVEKGIGYAYHISDSFVTDNTFKCGAGISYSAGTTVYRTADGYWDCFSNCFSNREFVVIDDGYGNVSIIY